MRHATAHPLAGQTVQIISGSYAGESIRVEDYWDRVSGGSWMDAVGNPAALNYAMMSVTDGLPLDDEVIYGKIGPFGYLVHVSQLAN